MAAFSHAHDHNATGRKQDCTYGIAKGRAQGAGQLVQRCRFDFEGLAPQTQCLLWIERARGGRSSMHGAILSVA